MTHKKDSASRVGTRASAQSAALAIIILMDRLPLFGRSLLLDRALQLSY